MSSVCLVVLFDFLVSGVWCFGVRVSAICCLRSAVCCLLSAVCLPFYLQAIGNLRKQSTQLQTQLQHAAAAAAAAGSSETVADWLAAEEVPADPELLQALEELGALSRTAT